MRDGRQEEPLLEVRGLRVEFRTGRRVVRAVNGVDFHVGSGDAHTRFMLLAVQLQ